MAIRGGPSTNTSPKERRLKPARVDWLLHQRNIQSKNSACDATLKRVRDEKNTKIAHMMEAMAVGSPFRMNSGGMSSRSMNLAKRQGSAKAVVRVCVCACVCEC